MERISGGPAFPTIMRDEDGYVSGRGHGMTLRDYFAAAALPTARQAFHEGHFGAESDNPINEVIAEYAYQIADAMLKERGK